MIYTDKVLTHITGDEFCPTLKEVIATVHFSQGDLEELQKLFDTTPPSPWENQFLLKIDESLSKVS